MATSDRPDTTPLLDSVVRRRCVPKAEIARYYLRAELPNVLVTEAAATLRAAVDRGVAALSEQDLWRLLEAMSFRYRLNRVFAVLTDTATEWHEVDLPLAAIRMTGVMPRIDDIVYSTEIDRDPIRFVALLRDYFAGHPDGDDPSGLGIFRPRGEQVALPIVLLDTEDGRPAMLDGTFRLVEMALAGAGTIRGYWAVRTARSGRAMAGDSAFVQLRDLYQRHRADPALAAAVLATARLLAADSTDGPAAIATYWVEHPRDPEIKRTGEALLAELRRPG
jgi:hypothetical protein